MFIDLQSKIDAFYKAAGMLKVIPALEKEISDWAVSVYCQKMVQIFDQTNNDAQVRKDLKYKLGELKNSDKLVALEKFITSSDIKHILPPKDSAYQFKISHFSLDRDEKTELTGVYDWIYSPPSIVIHIYNNGGWGNAPGDDYNFHLIINYEKIQYNTGPLKNITKDQIQSLLSSRATTIEKIIADFDEFVDNFAPFSKAWLTNIKKYRLECMRHIRTQDKNPTTFLVPADEMEDVRYAIPNSAKGRSIRVQANFVFSEQDAKNIYKEEQWSGLFDKGIIHVHKAPASLDYLDALPDILFDIKNTARHEAQHYIQWLIAYFNQFKDYGGLPSKKIREKSVDIHGLPSTTKGHEADRDRAIHQLRDIEFYTDLKDEVESFKETIKKFPVYLHTMLFNTWIGRMTYNGFKALAISRLRDHDDERYSLTFEHAFGGAWSKLYHGVQFFQTLKQNPGKYKKAVKEFYKEISYLL